MAIGSNPEIGVTFTRWGDMSEEECREWFRYMQRTFGPDLMDGYGRVIYIDRVAQSGTSTDRVEISEMVEEPIS